MPGYIHIAQIDVSDIDTWNIVLDTLESTPNSNDITSCPFRDLKYYCQYLKGTICAFDRVRKFYPYTFSTSRPSTFVHLIERSKYHLQFDCYPRVSMRAFKCFLYRY